MQRYDDPPPDDAAHQMSKPVTVLMPQRVYVQLGGDDADSLAAHAEQTGDDGLYEQMAALKAAKRTSRGYRVTVSAYLLDSFWKKTDNMALGAKADSGWDAEARADYNSAMAFLRRLDPLMDERPLAWAATLPATPLHDRRKTKGE